MIRYPQTNPPTVNPPFAPQPQSDWTRGIFTPAKTTADGIAAPFWQRPQTDLPPPQVNVPFDEGGIWGMIGQLQSLVSRMFAAFQSAFAQPTTPSPAQPNSPEQQFQNVTLGSTGDPHLAIDGLAGGPSGATKVSNHYDSMTSHSDLLHSNDFVGGYTVSTTVGTPDARGVTTNDSASIALNNDNDSISMAKDGSFSISSDGQAYTLANGQSMQLDGGETVTRNTDGSLSVSEQTASGGSLSTTLKSWGGGVDVNAIGRNVDLGGDIVNARS
jgi:hypothetical protein